MHRFNSGELQDVFLARLQPCLENDERICAAWLEGSFGRGDADRYSDIDLHLLMSESDAVGFREEAEVWLASIRPLVLLRLLFDGQMINALTVDGLRLDIWIHVGVRTELEPKRAAVLKKLPDTVVYVNTPVVAKDDQRPKLLGLINEFWRCISLSPSVVGRDELIVSTIGLGIVVRLLTDVLVDGYNVPHDAGVKKLNAFLPNNTRQAIESALSSIEMSRQSVALTNLRLAAIMQAHGPIVADLQGFTYPAELEQAVLAHVGDEFGRIGIDSDSRYAAA